MIDQTTIEKIHDAADIVEVISDFVSLKKRGANYIGLCPFHHEKTPSFSVSPSKGIYKCFGCGKGGNAVNFIMEHEHYSYTEALKYLGKKYQIEIQEREQTPEEQQRQNEAESLLIINSFAQKYFSDMLHNHPEGQNIGMSYFVERGFTPQIIEKFQLGYSPEQRDAFTREAIKNGYKASLLVKTGLTIEKEDYRFDRFRGRVMFPIHSLAGKVIAFGGRILKKEEKTAKYINSPESEIYHKSNVLYGAFFAKNAIVKEDKCFLVEGYTDVISLHQAGIENVVASSGTSLTQEQVRLMKRFTNNLTIIYDGDTAGIKASLRGIDIVLEEGLNVRVVLLPDGEDPDSFAKKKGPLNMQKYISEHETDFIVFKIQLLGHDSKDDPVKQANLITDIIRSIAIIPDSIIRAKYIKKCSELLHVEEKVLYANINKRRRKNFENKIKNTPRIENLINTKDTTHSFISLTKNECEAQEREIIRMLLNYGNHILYTHTVEDEYGDREVQTLYVADFIVNELGKDDLQIKQPVLKAIFDIYKESVKTKVFPDEKFFVSHENQQISKVAVDLLSKSYDLSKIWKRFGVQVDTEEMILKRMVPDIVFTFKEKQLDIELKSLTRKIKEAHEKHLDDDITLLQQQIMLITQAQKSLQKYRKELVL